MTGSPFSEYLRSMRRTGCGFSSLTLKFRMKPSLLRIRATSTFSFEAGSSTRSWCDVMPLRMRVSMSAIGSVIDIVDSWLSGRCLPARLGHARDVAAERQLPKTDAAKLKLTKEAARPTADLAAVAFARRELRLPLSLDHH